MHGTIKRRRLPVRAAEASSTWATEITASWQKQVTSIIETGRLLIEAKVALRHGQWGEMVAQLPFSLSTAEALMRIARHPVLSKSEFIQNLPPSWGALFEMTKLPEEALEALIVDGTINGNTRRRERPWCVR